jgi:hypothetical protein
VPVRRPAHNEAENLGVFLKWTTKHCLVETEIMRQKDAGVSPESIAIAGAWGYIGRKFLDAASALEIPTYVYDPGETPADVDIAQLKRCTGERQFYHSPVPFYHLALHPEHRRLGTDILLERGHREPLLVLCEKPMAAPECPEDCRRMVEATADLAAVVLYDFPELFDGMTRRIRQYLSRFKDVRIANIDLSRSKDREDPAIPRNYKRMVTIQYQEAVHCLAFVLSLLGELRGGTEAILDDGISVRAEAEPYNAPNPDDYPCVVDGRCQYTITLGGVEVHGHTNFKAGAQWTKRRVINGTVDARPFCIEAEYLEGHKRLVINGEDQGCDPAANSYEQVLLSAHAWQKGLARHRLMTGVYPNPSFARMTYQLSSVLWRSSYDGRQIRLRSAEELTDFDARFREEIPRLPRYGP